MTRDTEHKIFGYSWNDIQDRQQKRYHTPAIEPANGRDYGADPIGDGTFKMVPSGDIVDYTERCKRLKWTSKES